MSGPRWHKLNVMRCTAGSGYGARPGEGVPAGSSGENTNRPLDLPMTRR